MWNCVCSNLYPLNQLFLSGKFQTSISSQRILYDRNIMLIIYEIALKYVLRITGKCWSIKWIICISQVKLSLKIPLSMEDELTVSNWFYCQAVRFYCYLWNKANYFKSNCGSQPYNLYSLSPTFSSYKETFLWLLTSTQTWSIQVITNTIILCVVINVSDHTIIEFRRLYIVVEYYFRIVQFLGLKHINSTKVKIF